MPASSPSSDRSPSATRNSLIRGCTGEPRPWIPPPRSIPARAWPYRRRAPAATPTSGTPTPPDRPRAERWTLLLSGPGRSRQPVDLAATAAFAAGLLLVWSAVIHFHLWSETGGYRSLPAIGPLFLLQSIVGLVLGVGVVTRSPAVGGRSRDRPRPRHRGRVPHLGGPWALRLQGLLAGPPRHRGLHGRGPRRGDVDGRRCAVPRWIGSPRWRRLRPGRHRDVGTTPDRAPRSLLPVGRGPGSGSPLSAARRTGRLRGRPRWSSRGPARSSPSP